MSSSYSRVIASTKRLVASRRTWRALSLPMWVAAGFFAAATVADALYSAAATLFPQIKLVNSNVDMFVMSAVIYILTIALVVGLPWAAKINKTSWNDIGLQRLPSWFDILLAPAGAVVYAVTTMGLLALVSRMFTGFDSSQVQNVGFSGLNQSFEYTLAFVTLVVIAPIAEEVLFRGYLFGKLRGQVPTWLAIVITSLVFGAIHGAWNVAIDTFALSVVMCLLRVSTGSLWASILLHMLKNGVAFYILFINM